MSLVVEKEKDNNKINDKEKIVVIKKENIQRLISDVKNIIKNPLIDNGIYYKHDETDLLKGYALIIGPENTPYFGGFYFFQFAFPSDYPYSPPLVTYLTTNGKTRFNPNLYNNGKVCVSILNTWTGDKWSACQTISSVLLTLCTLLVDNPLQNEPGQTKTSREAGAYQNIIEYENINFSICDLIINYKDKLQSTLHCFYPIMLEHFLKNYKQITEFIHKKDKNKIVNVVSFYSMSEIIDYKHLEQKWVKTYEAINKWQEKDQEIDQEKENF
jgi:ubiquitin-protein ligase